MTSKCPSSPWVPQAARLQLRNFIKKAFPWGFPTPNLPLHWMWVSSCQGFCPVPSRFWYWLWKRHTSYLKTFAGRVAQNVSVLASLGLQFEWWGNRLHCSIVWSGVELSLSVYTSLHNYFCLWLSSGLHEPCTECHTRGAHAATTRSTEIKSVR